MRLNIVSVGMSGGLLAGCLVNHEVYEERRELLVDADGDGVNILEGDCDDSDAALVPGGAEQCDGIDNNCDGRIDEGLDTATWYPDADGDGFGDDEAAGLERCEEAVEGHVLVAGDCDDGDAAVNPEAVDVLDGVDGDCDGVVDVVGLDAVGEWWGAEQAFGHAGQVLLLHDLDGDGGEDLVVGGPGDESFVEDEPRVSVLMGASEGLADADVLVVSGDANSGLGASLAVAQGSDERSVLFAGAPEADWDGRTGGAVLLWADPVDEALYYDALPVLTTAVPGNTRLGKALASVGDWDGDGVGDVAVGDSSADSAAGVVYIVPADTEGGVVEDEAMLTVHGVVTQGHLGGDLAGGADLDGDGLPEVVSSAFDADLDESEEGLVYVFQGGTLGSADADAAVAWAAGGVEGARLGRGLGMYDDLDEDGRAEVVLGARRGSDELGGPRLIVFQGRLEGLLNLAEADWERTTANPAFDFNESFSRQADEGVVALGWAAGAPELGPGVRLLDLGEGQAAGWESSERFVYSDEVDASGTASVVGAQSLWVGASGAGDQEQGGVWRVPMQ